MKKALRRLAILFTMIAFTSPASAQYPEKNLQGIIMWGAGGALDNVTRAVSPKAGDLLGKTIIMQNKPGATGAIALTTVANAPADGYTLLFGAENPNLYKVTGLSRLDYDQFDPVVLFMANVGVVVVPKNSPYKSFKDLISAAKEGKSLKLGSTGPGGLPYVATNLIQNIHGLKFNLIQFDEEGPAITALMGGHIDAVAVGLLAASNYIDGGSVNGLAVISTKRVDAVKNVPTVTEEFPGMYESHLPWGAFFGVFSKKDSPAEAFNKLQDAFMKSCNDPSFGKFAERMGGLRLCITGNEARAYIKQNQSVSSWLLHEAGGTKESPEKFGIPKLQKK